MNNNKNMQEGYDVPKYKKKRPSSRSKSSKRSDHRHDYSRDVLVKVVSPNFSRAIYFVGKQCTICGKIANKPREYPDGRNEDGSYYLLDEDEILKKYSHLPLITHQGLL